MAYWDGEAYHGGTETRRFLFFSPCLRASVVNEFLLLAVVASRGSIWRRRTRFCGKQRRGDDQTGVLFVTMQSGGPPLPTAARYAARFARSSSRSWTVNRDGMPRCPKSSSNATRSIPDSRRAAAF